jgi:ABC-type multidrug transport system fused ATPase/permease subunit
VDGDVATLSNFFSRFVVQMFANAVLLVAVLALMFTIDWRVGLATTVFVVITVALVNKMRNMSVSHWRVARQASAELFGFLEERLSGTEDIRSSGATAYTMRRLYERSRNLLRTDRKAALIGSSSGSVTIIVFTLGTALALPMPPAPRRLLAFSLGSRALFSPPRATPTSFSSATSTPMRRKTRSTS